MANERGEARLLIDYAAGDRAALADLVGRRWAGAYRSALAALGDRADAEDATQEAFVGLIRSAPRFRAGAPFDPWWATILRNAIRKTGRGRARRAALRRAVADRPPAPTPTPAADPDLAALRELERAVAALPPELRDPIRLHYYEQRTHAEVAAALGWPVGTVASRIRRGVARLRADLAERRHGFAVAVALVAAAVCVTAGVGALVFGVGWPGAEDALARRRDETMLATLRNALARYHADHQDYPADDAELAPLDPDTLAPTGGPPERRRGSAALLHALMARGARGGPYLTPDALPPAAFSRRRADGAPDLADPACVLLDAAGRPIVYERQSRGGYSLGVTNDRPPGE